MSSAAFSASPVRANDHRAPDLPLGQRAGPRTGDRTFLRMEPNQTSAPTRPTTKKRASPTIGTRTQNSLLAPARANADLGVLAASTDASTTNARSGTPNISSSAGPILMGQALSHAA